jgi:2-keto-4-pentenoate hydratase/2-oxohepta-3-ene-1,7-dioic acid hydratase in catechol pathway
LTSILNKGVVVRLISCRTGARETLGIEIDGRWLPATAVVDDAPSTLSSLIAAGLPALDRLRAAAPEHDVRERGDPLADAELLPPVGRPGKIVAIGRNYREHAAEEGAEPPVAPLIFAKWPSSVIGPGAEIRWDAHLSTQVDYEAELAVVIGRAARRVSTADALNHVFGYTCLNDVSARDLQFGDGQWVRGKSLDTFCPMGPGIVTADEIGDPQRLRISATVNDELVQDASTAQMYFPVAELISFCSFAFTLEPGDVIATGTPSGVGAFRQPPRFLDGDRVVVEIERIGRLENICRVEPVEAAA